MLLDELLRELGVPGVELRLGSLGSLEARAAYREELQAYLRDHEAELSDGRARADRRQPAARLRLRRRGHAGGDGGGADDARPARRRRRRALRRGARRCSTRPGVAYELDGTLVRGLDYYTRTVFAFDCDRLGAQSEIGGGGRYDGLVEQLGGPPTPAVGWAAGIERILLALGERGRARRPATSSSPSPTRPSASARWRWSPSCATPGSRPSSTSPGAASRAR